MVTETLADRGPRERALDPGRSFIVEAPAGSGKTTLITQRFLRLLSLVEQPEAIVAITFTRKAAEEMRGRVLNALKVAREAPETLDSVTAHWAGKALAASEQRDWRLLDNPRRLRMQTIDSLSAILAKRGPLMSGYAGNPEVLEDAAHLYRRAANATITELEGGEPWSDSIRILLRHLDNDWERLENLLGEMLRCRDQWLRFIVGEPDREACERTLQRAVGAELQRLSSTLPERFHENIVQLSTFAATNLARDYPDSIGAALADLTGVPGADCSDLIYWQALAELLLTRNGALRSRLTIKDGFPPKESGVKNYKVLFAQIATELAQIPDFLAALDNVRTIPQTFYSDQQWRSIEALFLVLKLASAELKVVFERSAAVDFVEISHAALAALGAGQDPSDLGLILDYQIQHLLVDEFQDTSITQFELIERLLDGWNEGDGRSLFLVGDPMQSIYRFRQADVNLFIDTCKVARLASVPLEVLQLTTNFRTQAGVIDWLNGVLEHMRADSECPFLQVPKVIAARPKTCTHAVKNYGFLANDDVAEANQVVAIIRQTQIENPGHTIGVLVRGRRHLGSISAALVAEGISVRATDIERLGEQPIIQDLVALTRALLHPADRAAWIGVLRAPWCGLSLESLSALFENSFESTIWQRLSAGFETAEISPVESDLLTKFFRIISITQRSVGREPFVALLERTWIALGGPEAYGERSLIHAERYFELLNGYMRPDNLLTAKRLDELLDRQYVAPPPDANSTVEIMTIHHAKGLEFDVVILPGLGHVPPPDRPRLLAWERYFQETGSSLLFAPIPEVGSRGDSIHAYLQSVEKKALKDEGYRLLYVALTRTRETLHLIATVKPGKEDSLGSHRPRSFLGMLSNIDNDGWNFLDEKGPINPGVGEKSTGIRQPLRRPQLVQRERHHPNPYIGTDNTLAAVTAVEFEWASPLAKHIGTVTHSLLHQICTEGLSQWNVAKVHNAKPYIHGRLRSFGVGQSALPEARDRIIMAVVSTLQSTRGRWILDDQHTNAKSEYALSSVVDRVAKNAIIDRTFVDENGVRWIIDFKTGAHTGGSKDAFVSSEVDRYRPQLDGYADLLHAWSNRPIALGLFFPLLGEWREWQYPRSIK